MNLLAMMKLMMVVVRLLPSCRRGRREKDRDQCRVEMRRGRGGGCPAGGEGVEEEMVGSSYGCMPRHIFLFSAKKNNPRRTDELVFFIVTIDDLSS